MIRVLKPATPPTVLTTRGAKATADASAEYDRDPPAYRTGASKLPEPDSKIYAHETVRDALRTAQHDKCAFCESVVTHITPGDIEHYRPKRGYRQRPAEPLTYPAYYWLAYDWDNLFLACPLCNQRFKENLFPLRVQKARARCHHDDHTREKPVLLHPGRDNPGRHITYRDEVAVPKTARGRATIALLGLDRKELNDRRAERRRALQLLRRFRDGLLADLARAPTAEARSALAEVERALAGAILPSAEYSAMARVVLV